MSILKPKINLLKFDESFFNKFNKNYIFYYLQNKINIFSSQRIKQNGYLLLYLSFKDFEKKKNEDEFFILQSKWLIVRNYY
jgi:hypothetical protein